MQAILGLLTLTLGENALDNMIFLPRTVSGLWTDREIRRSSSASGHEICTIHSPSASARR